MCPLFYVGIAKRRAMPGEFDNCVAEKIPEQRYVPVAKRQTMSGEFTSPLVRPEVLLGDLRGGEAIYPQWSLREPASGRGLRQSCLDSETPDIVWRIQVPGRADGMP